MSLLSEISPISLIDFYKASHGPQYPVGTEFIYSNFTPRKSRVNGCDFVVFAGLQYFIMEYLLSRFNDQFFDQPIKQIVQDYNRIMDSGLGENSVKLDHIIELHELGYLPLKIKALKEGTIVPIGVPVLTVINTDKRFFWLTNYVETLMSNILWKPTTSATTAFLYRKEFERHARLTGSYKEFIKWQGHDFSFRGMSGVEDAVLSGFGHALSFHGSDTVPVIPFCDIFYGSINEFVVGSVPATEHSVMCMGLKESEIDTFKRLITELYPDRIISIVSDTWDFWKVMTEYLPLLKGDILARNGRVVIRPDSGEPVDIICGTGMKYLDLSDNFDGFDPMIEEFFPTWENILLDEVREETPHGELGVDSYSNIYQIKGKYYEVSISNIQWNRYDKQYYFIDMYEKGDITIKELPYDPEFEGAYEILWNIFGGIINDKGYKLLDPHIGLIYGDSITLDRQKEILTKLEAKGFAASNLVLGIGSYTYEYVTRDTFGFAMKATWGVVNGEPRAIFKDPKTDAGFKKSAKGLLKVYFDNGVLKLKDKCTPLEETEGVFETVFENGNLLKVESLSNIRARIDNNF